jgi:hypothetical protein
MTDLEALQVIKQILDLAIKNGVIHNIESASLAHQSYLIIEKKINNIIDGVFK